MTRANACVGRDLNRECFWALGKDRRDAERFDCRRAWILPSLFCASCKAHHSVTGSTKPPRMITNLLHKRMCDKWSQGWK